MASIQYKRIVFFDVDHTLVKGNSGYYTSFHLVKHGILKKRRIAQAVYYSLAAVFFMQDVKKIYQIAINDMAGNSMSKMLEIGHDCFEKDVKPRLFVDGLRLLKEHQQKGDHVVLLTSAPSMLIQILKEYLQVEEVYCMGPELKGEILTDILQVPICHAEGKVHYAEQVSKKYGVPLSECYFYSDHLSDLHLLEKVGHPIVVNPGWRLKRIAKKQGWPVLRFEKTLGSVRPV